MKIDVNIPAPGLQGHGTYWLAQENQAFSIPGEDAATGTAGTGADGAASGSGSSAAPLGGGGSGFMILMVVLMAVIFFSIFGQRRDRKKREAMLSAIKKHDKVQTIGGVIGSIIEVKTDVVLLKVDESSNTRITVARSAVQQVLSPNTPAAEVKAPAPVA